MRQNLEANEIDPDEIPIVLQYNKRDLPERAADRDPQRADEPAQLPLLRGDRGEGGRRRGHPQGRHQARVQVAVRRSTATGPPRPRLRAEPRALPAPVRPAARRHSRSRPSPSSTDDLLGELDLGGPEPEASPPGLPPIELEEQSSPELGVRPGGRGCGRRARTPPPPAPAWSRRSSHRGRRSRRTARRARSSPAATRPTSCAAASPLPGFAAEDVEMDLEEIEDFDHPDDTRKLVPGAPARNRPSPEPVLPARGRRRDRGRGADRHRGGARDTRGQPERQARPQPAPPLAPSRGSSSGGAREGSRRPRGRAFPYSPVGAENTAARWMSS